jgi:hypothetical protein
VRKTPWQKQASELTKYDWLTAICHNPKHSRRTRDLRVAQALMQLADADTMLAWPTQETLAELSGLADSRQVRSALASMAGSGAIAVVKLSELSDETRDELAIKRRGRGKAYRLKSFWAYEILEASRSPVTKRSQPEKLRAGKAAKRTKAVLSERTTTDRFRADYNSPAYTSVDTGRTLKPSTEGNNQLGVYAREANSYAAMSRGE